VHYLSAFDIMPDLTNLSYTPVFDKELSSKIIGNITHSRSVGVTTIPNTSRVTIIIGKNNSGKSYLIKSLIRNNSNQTTETMLQGVETAIHDFSSTLENLIKKYSISMIEFQSNTPLKIVHNELNITLQKTPQEFVRYITEDVIFDRSTILIRINTILHALSHYSSDIDTISWFVGKYPLESTLSEELNQSIVELTANIITELKQLQSLLVWHEISTQSLYVPITRSLKNYSINQEPSLITRRNQEELRAPGATIIDGQGFFEIIFKHSNSSLANRKKVLEYERFLSSYFFDSKEVKLISNIEEGDSHQRNQVRIIIDEEERFLDEMGDGIQQIIILTYPLFFYSGGVMVIEEPEINLEPRYQKRLISIFQNHKRSKKFLFFISTHSNNILDCSLEEDSTTILSIKKLRVLNDVLGLDSSTKKRINHNQFPYYQLSQIFGPTSELLHELGVKPSSLVMTNGIIWVEGPSDVVYIDALLSIYQIKRFGGIRYKRGVHYEYLMYGGSLLRFYDTKITPQKNEHLTRKLINLFKINPNYFVVFDSDRVGGNDISSFGMSKQAIFGALPENRRWLDESIKTIEDYVPLKYSIISDASKKSKTNTAFITTQHWFDRIQKNNFKWSEFPQTLKGYLNTLYDAIDMWNN
jgi:AAA15 family ATPase/GTPase